MLRIEEAELQVFLQGLYWKDDCTQTANSKTQDGSFSVGIECQWTIVE
jgi:hypothetical protein